MSGFVGSGSIFRISTNSFIPEVLHEFDNEGLGYTTQQDLVYGSDGAIYGWAHPPGSSTDGLLFRFSPEEHTFTKLITADQAKTTGWQELLEGSDGRIYAIAGLSIVRVARDGSGFQVIHPLSNFALQLFEGSDGRIYVVDELGLIFSMAKDGSDVRIVRDFSTAPVPGATRPRAVFEASDGFLYGALPGISDNGPIRPKIFKINRGGLEFAVVRELETFPEGNLTYGNDIDELIETPDGKLVGTVRTTGLQGPGYAFELGKDGSEFRRLFNFPADYVGFDAGANVNRSAPCYLLNGPDGLIYGTMQGSTTVRGFIYRFAPDGSGFTNLYLFTPPLDPGATPDSALVVTTDGTVLGATRNSAFQGAGTVFKFDGDLLPLRTFFSKPPATGLNPSAVTLGSDGQIYGVAAAGGSDGFGTVFRLAPDGSALAALRSFAGTGGDGRVPRAALIEASDQRLYGSTMFGGGAGAGTIFGIGRDGTGYQILVRFTNNVSGSNIVAQLLEGQDGRLYGTAVFGGPQGGGTLFRLEKSGAGFTVVRSFPGTGTSLRNPMGALVQDADRTLLGTASAGGSAGFGGVFRIKPDGSEFRSLHDFSDQNGDGRVPEAGVVFGVDGFIYGTTRFGGGAVNGSIFRLKPDGTSYEKLRGFSGQDGDGANPQAALAVAPDGALYGTTSAGGKRNLGVLFRLSFATEAPRLTIQKLGESQIQIEWSPSAQGYRLETANSLASPIAWSAIGQAISTDTKLQLPAGTNSAFYRLTKP